MAEETSHLHNGPADRQTAAVPQTGPIARVSREAYRARQLADGGLVTADAGSEGESQAGARPRELQFSLFFFSADGSTASEDKYRLLHESARYADRHGFAAVWTPERHFDPFGGLYPNPSVASAALAMITEHLQLRAGSVVLPLQNPIRVAEEWSVVDNLSRGRVGVAFASGWHVDDFSLSPETYTDRKAVMFERIDVIQRLWRGEVIRVPNGAGKAVEVRLLPRPLQPLLPIWITSQSDETFIRAGQMGLNVLTNLHYKTLADFAERIALYRKARAEHGHDPQSGQVTLMLHTFLQKSMDVVRANVRSGYASYLLSNLGLQMRNAQGMDLGVRLTEDDRELLMSNALERLFQSHGLVGTPESCLERVQRLREIGVTEIACLIDFGIDFEYVMEGLEYLTELKERCNSRQTVVGVAR
jgi:natural product biosynthesis luciferase-like monooxygenase protein